MKSCYHGDTRGLSLVCFSCSAGKANIKQVNNYLSIETHGCIVLDLNSTISNRHGNSIQQVLNYCL